MNFAVGMVEQVFAIIGIAATFYAAGMAIGAMGAAVVFRCLLMLAHGCLVSDIYDL